MRDGRVLVQYRGVPFDWRKRVATIGLNTSIPWTIDVVGGVNRIEADLREVDVRRFELTGGTDRIQLEFGRPVGDVPIRIVGGARTIRLERPAGAPVRLRIQGSASAVGLDGTAHGKKGGDVDVESRGWSGRADRFSSRGRRRLEVDRHRRAPRLTDVSRGGGRDGWPRRSSRGRSGSKAAFTLSVSR